MLKYRFCSEWTDWIFFSFSSPAYNHGVRIMDLSVCVFAPHVFPVTQFLPHVDCWFDSRCVSSSSLIVLSLKAPVHSVSVCRSLNVFPVCTSCYPVGLLKTRLWIPRLLVPCFLALCSWEIVTEGPTEYSYLRVSTLRFYFRLFPQCFVSVVFHGSPLPSRIPPPPAGGPY